MTPRMDLCNSNSAYDERAPVGIAHNSVASLCLACYSFSRARASTNDTDLPAPWTRSTILLYRGSEYPCHAIYIYISMVLELSHPRTSHDVLLYLAILSVGQSGFHSSVRDNRGFHATTHQPQRRRLLHDFITGVTLPVMMCDDDLGGADGRSHSTGSISQSVSRTHVYSTYTVCHGRSQPTRLSYARASAITVFNLPVTRRPRTSAHILTSYTSFVPLFVHSFDRPIQPLNSFPTLSFPPYVFSLAVPSSGACHTTTPTYSAVQYSTSWYGIRHLATSKTREGHDRSSQLAVICIV
ncbi:hypothetical protein BJV74DRAFT_124881 [Russula compacta]|nr:hypothetical protein BJV74DRAFT_124881 [Russula compacta]